jgi:signal transduction histidine kinase
MPGAAWFMAFEAILLRGILLAAVARSQLPPPPGVVFCGAMLWLLAIVAWRLQRRSALPGMLLPLATITWWLGVIATTGLGASPWVLGIMLEVGLAALRLSPRGCAVASATGVAALAFVAARDATAAGSMRAWVALACVAVVGPIYVILLRRPRRHASDGDALATAHVAHDVKSRLHAVSGFAELLATDLGPDDPRHRFAQSIRRGLAEANAGLADLMAPERRGAGVVTPLTDLGARVDRALESCRVLLERACVQVDNRVPRGIASSVDARTLDSVLVEIIQNAVQAMPAGGGSLVLIGSSDPPGVTIRDSGPGIPVALRERIFEPRFTTRPGGRGLGLSGVRDRLQTVGGSVRAGAAPEGGGEIRIELPRHDRWSAIRRNNF